MIDLNPRVLLAGCYMLLAIFILAYCSERRALALNKPLPDVPHYRAHPSGVECKDIVQEFSYNIGTAMAYLWRAELKHDDPREDIGKAIDHLHFELDRLNKIEGRSDDLR